jgi:hypothetical protein
VQTAAYATVRDGFRGGSHRRAVRRNFPNADDSQDLIMTPRSFPVLTIRDEQLSALGATLAFDFESRARAYLLRLFPSYPWLSDDVAAQAAIRAGIEDARGHGICREHDVLRFLALHVGLGPNFDRAPEHEWISSVLSCDYLPADVRLARIFAGLADRDAVGGGR